AGSPRWSRRWGTARARAAAAKDRWARSSSEGLQEQVEVLGAAGVAAADPGAAEDHTIGDPLVGRDAFADLLGRAGNGARVDPRRRQLGHRAEVAAGVRLPDRPHPILEPVQREYRR